MSKPFEISGSAPSMKVACATSIPSPALINGSILTIFTYWAEAMTIPNADVGLTNPPTTPAFVKFNKSTLSQSDFYGTPCAASLPTPATSMAHLTAGGASTRYFPTPNEPPSSPLKAADANVSA
ncbi:hypothetical protein SAICODRAFT_66039, partial [Saitoella complicata NRRL Y-17804]|uniref:uncharacterized protein n=1 Tax=Saitoella complicata (strain BCRC 22490 / CBS 7301 / JCM 7358 / NBRC 10748 / NRRL Y-17804) TaxID=698492 RepID=UPI000866F955